MLLVAELDLGKLELALLFDVGLLRPVDHDVGDVGVVEQLFQRPKAEQFVDQHLFERELLAPVEVDLQLGEHFADDRAEFLSQLVLGERRCGFRIDALEQAGEDLLLDPVDRGFKAFILRGGLVAGRLRLAIVEARHRIAALGGRGRSGGALLDLERGGVDRRELAAAVGRTGRGRALHRGRSAEARPAAAAAVRTIPSSKSTHGLRHSPHIWSDSPIGCGE